MVSANDMKHPPSRLWWHCRGHGAVRKWIMSAAVRHVSGCHFVRGDRWAAKEVRMEDILQGRLMSRKQGGAGPPCGGGDSSNKTFHRIDPDSVGMVEGDRRKILGWKVLQPPCHHGEAMWLTSEEHTSPTHRLSSSKEGPLTFALFWTGRYSLNSAGSSSSE